MDPRSFKKYLPIIAVLPFLFFTIQDANAMTVHLISDKISCENNGLFIATWSASSSTCSTSTSQFTIPTNNNLVIAKGITMNFTGSLIESSGQIDNYGKINAIHGTMNNLGRLIEPTGLLNHGGAIINLISGQVINSVSANGVGKGIRNSGTINVGDESGGAKLVDYSYASNSGTINIMKNTTGTVNQLIVSESNTFDNTGTITSSGLILDAGIFKNNALGVIQNNAGTIKTIISSDFENNGGMIKNNGGSMEINQIIFKNNGGTVENNGGTFKNNGGTVENNGGTFKNNLGTIDNYGIMKNNSGGILENTGSIIKNHTGGSIENNFSTINNNLGSSIKNSGTITNNCGTVNNLGTISGNAIVNVSVCH